MERSSRTWALVGTIAFVCVLLGDRASPRVEARPPGPSAFCDVYPDAPACTGGQVQCTFCHSTPPARNAFGAALSEVLAPGAPRPLDDATFERALPGALRAIEEGDSDGDGASNRAEILAGTIPADRASVPIAIDCEVADARMRYDVCRYDARYALGKIYLDVCGRSATLEERAMAPTDEAVSAALDACLESENWRARDGVLWNLANRKVGPIAAVKSGEGAGDIPLADYFDDYNLFVYTQTGGRDARELLTARYIVERADGPPTIYTRVERTAQEDADARGFDVAQLTAPERRAGMITTRWFLMSNTMFTALPRTTAAQAYRSYLGLDITRLEGLYPVEGEPVDYDRKGVARAECAGCHSTLDPLTYPFASYEGLGGGEGPMGFASYNPGRLARFTRSDGPRITEVPETGRLLGREVSDLIEWAAVAAESDEFARATVLDYWRLFLGEPPRPDELAELDELVRRFREVHGYSVEAMLHDLVRTEAYGVP